MNPLEQEKHEPYSVSSLAISPIKSCRMINVESAELTGKGFKYDREFMLVNKDGKFLTQRELPSMAQIEIELIEGGLKVRAPNMPQLFIPGEIDLETTPVELWDDHFIAFKYPSNINDWFSDFLKINCRLVRQIESLKRPVSSKYAIDPSNEVNLGDGYPIHIVTEATLNKLNQDMGIELPIDRFRANIVIPGKFPNAENFWGTIKIGDVELVLVKACYRCAITRTDQLTGERGREPLWTLSQTSRNEKGVYFGQYAIPRGRGVIKLGDKVEIIRQK